MKIEILIAAALGWILTSVMLPLVIRGANRHQLLDHPDGGRRIHPRPIPRLGGVAIWFGVILASVAVLAMTFAIQATAPRDSNLLTGLLIGCSIVFVTGLLDDLRGIPPVGKLIAQGFAAAVVI